MMDSEIDELFKNFIKFCGFSKPIIGQVNGCKISIKCLRWGKDRTTYKIVNRTIVEIEIAMNEVPLTKEQTYDFPKYKKKFSDTIKRIINKI